MPLFLVKGNNFVLMLETATSSADWQSPLMVPVSVLAAVPPAMSGSFAQPYPHSSLEHITATINKYFFIFHFLHLIYAGSGDGSVYAWSVRSGKEVHSPAPVSFRHSYFISSASVALFI